MSFVNSLALAARAAGLSLFLFAALSGCGASERQNDGVVPGHMGGDPATATTHEVEIFAPGSVSTELPEFATSFSPGGDTVFFNRTPQDRSRIDLLISVRGEEGWSEAVPFGPLEEVRAVDPFVSPDGSVLYFSSNLPRPGGMKGAFNLWRLDMRSPSAVPEALPEPVNSDSSDIFNSVSRDGTMVFSSRRDGTRRLYRVQLDDNGQTLTTPEVLSVSRDGPASNPAISPDGALLVFARSEEDVGPPNLYLSCRGTAGWSEPIRLPEPINGPYTEFAPGFGGEYLYFTSERPGLAPALPAGVRPPGDLYRTPVDAVRTLCPDDRATD